MKHFPECLFLMTYKAGCRQNKTDATFEVFTAVKIDIVDHPASSFRPQQSRNDRL